MATATDPAQAAVDVAAVRRTVAEAIEKLRALELPADEAETVREVALTALRAVATALFTDAHAATDCPGALAGLIAEDIGRITILLAAHPAEPQTGTGSALAGRWRR
jgi:hypothetical protein